MIEILESNELLSNIIIIILLTLAIIFLCIGVFKNSSENNYLKIGGIFLISLLAIKSKASISYFIAIFIIATIIAKVDYLETLAAIIFRSKDYMKYKIALLKSNKNEIMEHKVKEMQESNEKTYNQTDDQIRKNIDVFIKGIYDYLDRNSFIRKYKLTEYFRLDINDKEKIYIDAIAKTSTTDFLYDVNNLTNPTKIYNVILQIEKNIISYSEYLKKLGIKRKVKALLVIPEDIITEDILNEDIGVLKYDSNINEITNLDKIINWMDIQ